MPPFEHFTEPSRRSESTKALFNSYDQASKEPIRHGTGYTRENAAQDAKYMQMGWYTNAVIVDGSGANITNRAAGRDKISMEPGVPNRSDGTVLGPKQSGVPNPAETSESIRKQPGVPNPAETSESTRKRPGVPNRVHENELGITPDGITNRRERSGLETNPDKSGLPNNANRPWSGESKNLKLGPDNTADRSQTHFMPKDQKHIGPDNKVDTLDSIKETIKDIVRYFGQ